MSSALDKLGKRSVAVASSTERVIEVPLDKIRFDPTQPRKAFHPIDGQIAQKDADYITELAESIDKGGLIQPITVQEVGDGSYLVVVGECRTRAHLQLGKKTIRAVVRNDLTDAAKRLLYQLAENVNRQDLTDEELALSIRDLMKGSDTVGPMSQVQIAKTLGKSEGWVSRFVKFGDAELQRIWVKTGIADTVEKVYRLSILPKSAQVEILRRVALPKKDPEHLAKPINRDVIDLAAREVKMAPKKTDQKQVPTPPSEPDVAALTNPPLPRENAQGGDAVGDAFAASVIQNHAAQLDANPQATAAATSTPAKYQLPDDARAAILGSVPLESQAAGQDESGSSDPVQPPVHCRVSVGSVMALLAALKSNEQALGAIDGVQCDLNIPGPLAQLIANQLTGVIVDRREVPAIMQMELAKLH